MKKILFGLFTAAVISISSLTHAADYRLTMNTAQTKPIYYDTVEFSMVWWDLEAEKLSVRYRLGYMEGDVFIQSKEYQTELTGAAYTAFTDVFNVSDLAVNPAEKQFLNIVNQPGGEFEGVISEIAE